MTQKLLCLGALLAAALGAQSCAKSGCIGKGPGCKVEPPCPKVSFTCASTQLEAFQIDGGVAAARPPGTNALATNGDFVLKNAFTTVVIAGLGNQNYLDPAGGSLLDLSAAGGADGVNQVLTVTGILPGDAAHYTAISIIESGPERVAVQVEGTLDGHPDLPIYTRYELQPCDTGVRVRTEILNASPDNQFWGLTDGYYWSKREPIPFTAGKGQGFTHPSFDLLTINGAYQPFPFLAFNLHNAEPSSYAAVSCTSDQLEGFNSETVSTAGLPRQVVPPRGWLAFERFLAVAAAPDVEGAARIALSVREQVLGEKHVKITGKVERPHAVAAGTETAASVVVSEGTMAQEEKDRTPWTQVVPQKDGTFTATVPAGKTYVVTVDAFGHKVFDRLVENVSADTDLGTVQLVTPDLGTVRFEVTETGGGGGQLDAEIYLVAADEATRTGAAGTFHGQYTKCTPWLGAPPGPSPACNRVLVHEGVATAEIPAGTFHVYAYHGPFWSLGHQLVTIPGPQTLQFQLTRLPLLPPGAITADLHVHGAASFDSSIPDYDRVLSFAASDLDVIVATDHDVVYDYAAIVRQLNLQTRLTTVTGVETTGHVPYLTIPNYGYPLVIGHYNFWPLTYDPGQPRNGGVFDEFIEPGELFKRAKAKMGAHAGIFQLNHPWAAAEFGRDLGFPRAIKMDLRKDLPPMDDGADGRGVYVRTPPGAGYRNNQHDSQEVMNGSQNDTLIQYRAFWFYLLNQGEIHAGTANSDSHSLTDNTVGIPRNVIYGAGPTFDVDVFDAAIRNGRVLGTSAPIIEATVDGMTGRKDFGTEPFKPLDGGKLHLKVSSAPWAPVPEVRIVVNGQVVKTIAAAPLPTGHDPFGATVDVAFEGDVALSDLLGGITGDAWIVVEASRPLPVAEDLGGGLNGEQDGMPDTTDNNGDGKIDKADVEKDSTYGPLRNLPFPADTDPLVHFANVTDNGFPYAFTNPFLLDRNGTPGFQAPGVNGGR